MDTDILCRSCSSLLPNAVCEDAPPRRWTTYPDFPEIKATASKGCALCPLYLEALGEMFDEQGRPPEGWDVARDEDDPWPVPNWNHVLTISNPPFPKRGARRKVESSVKPTPPRSDRGFWGLIQFNVWADAGHRLTGDIGDAAALHGGYPLRLPDKNSLSDVNTARILGWLDNCVDEHACCKTEKLPRLPTRIIDVGSLGGQSPRLLETNRRPAQYLALSHCWGALTASKENLRLLQSNFQDLLTEIPIKSLSKNFQDAIEVVRKLKFKYLWIDALCIIQDSKSDWENESARMNDVYECAHLTIVATTAVSSNEGFLQRPAHPVVTLPYRAVDDSTIEGRFFITRSMLGGFWPWDLVEKTAWNTRGWTFQERLLSRRLLHFTSSILFWECRGTDRSEINARERPLTSRPRWILSGPEDEQAVVDPLYSIDTAYHRWYIILRGFTGRKFTYTTDLLPAASGLATIFRELFAAEDDYIAGLWSGDFPQGLLWLVHDSITTRKAVLDYWAPSWSWASIAGPVSWPTRSVPRHQRDDFAVQLLENHLNVTPENPMGSVLGGYIRMRGRLRQLSCTTGTLRWGELLRFRYDLWSEGDTLVGNGQFDADRDDNAEEVWLLQMKFQEEGDCFFPYHPTALMLERLSGSLLRFVRLGCAVLENDQLDFFDAFLQVSTFICESRSRATYLLLSRNVLESIGIFNPVPSPFSNQLIHAHPSSSLFNHKLPDMNRSITFLSGTSSIRYHSQVRYEFMMGDLIFDF
ncbi:MAG: hypothetical protein Q9169_001148 [Polycauliona sp. 2 TL-2023]